MADEPRHASQIREWVQTLVIVVGVGLGLWQFWFKEIWIPAGAPINITTEVSVKRAGFRGASSGVGNEHFEALELAVVAKNPSSRDVWVVSNCWHAQGIAIVTRNQGKDWANTIAQRIEKHEPSNEGAYYKWDKTLVVAAGEVFTEDQLLHPNESISTSVVFYVPQDVYDVLHVRVELPTTAVADSAEVVWTVTPDKGCNSRVYRKRNNARGTEIVDFPAAFLDRHVQFQSATSTRELSLWQSKPPEAATTKPLGTPRSQ
jgi:hypothetical protein